MPKINDKLILGLLFIILALMNIAGIINLNEQAVLGFTLAALFISISGMFEGYLSNFFYFLGIVSMIILPWLNDNIFARINVLDPNTILVLGVGVSFLSIYINQLNEQVILAEYEKREKEMENKVWYEVKEQVYKERENEDGDI